MFAYDVMGNSQRLDGGALFGNAPRALWSRWHEPDELNRIPLACRCLLIQDGTCSTLIETGIGAFFPPELQARYGVVETNHVLLDSLAARGLSHEDISTVILSHLHFDHAGGLLDSYRAEAEPKLLFPNARFVVGQTAFARAQAPHPRDRASFITALPSLLMDSGRLVLVDESHPERAGLGPHFRFHVSNGHTPGMLLTEVVGERARVLFCADLVPGRAWTRTTISMGYDRFPELLLDEKVALLGQALRDETWLFYTHDPDVALGRLTTDAKGQYVSTQELATLDAFQL